MHQLIKEILTNQKVQTANGEEILLNSSIDEDEVKFITDLMEKANVRNSAEIGCAMGISSLAICNSLKEISVEGHHIIIDPFQSSDWQNIGKNNLEKAGFKNFTIYEERSELILPMLVKEGRVLDFAFIDGWHTFDHTLIDFFYLNRMLKVGGIIVIDDVQMTAVNKVTRYIHNYPCYEFVGSVKRKQTRSRDLLEGLKSILRPFAKLFGKRFSEEIFSSSLLKSDKSLDINASMVAFKKIAEDNDRPWNWYKNF